MTYSYNEYKIEKSFEFGENSENYVIVGNVIDSILEVTHNIYWKKKYWENEDKQNLDNKKKYLKQKINKPKKPT